ncbi:hypothetical protein J0895_17765 [Phormidium pseudopriestleyi FRX01]|uniref:Uncharacterized protein n=1 Tax=Phormidium pseudopriestleyi FRX01 TaxID=1759528 RepID=A0ABS3FUZ7_9CYAN|nr:hypothetical protein [Phormidium pseudopriestleyi]MBO0350878.1 hypothetical protein [Phormidium pseudopriestleyi FRX01]
MAKPRHALTVGDRACMEAGAHLFLRASAIARHSDTPPTSFYAQVRSHVTMTPP